MAVTPFKNGRRGSVAGSRTQESPFRLRRELDLLAASEISDALLPIIDAGQGNPNNFGDTRARAAFAEVIQLSVEWMQRKRRGDPKLPALDGPLWQALVTVAERQARNPVAVLKEVLRIAYSASYPKQPQPKVLEAEILEFARSVHAPSGLAKLGKDSVLMTSGASGAAQAVLRALINGGVIEQRSKVVILAPVYAPVVEVCKVLEMEVAHVCEEYSGDTISSELADHLKDPALSLLISVNPGNPIGGCFSSTWIDSLRKNLAERPDVIIIEDAAYAAFLGAPPSMFDQIPDQTILLGSFSKIVGMCGIRAGYALLSEGNVVEKKLETLDVPSRYSTRIVKPYSFLERCWLEVGDVSFSHTGSVSTQSLVLVALFSALWNSDQEARVRYLDEISTELESRHIALWRGLGFEKPLEALPACAYHCWLNVSAIVEAMTSPETARSFDRKWTMTEFAKHLAKTQNAIALPGEGFLSKDGSYLRACVGSLDDAAACEEFGARLQLALSATACTL